MRPKQLRGGKLRKEKGNAVGCQGSRGARQVAVTVVVLRCCGGGVASSCKQATGRWWSTGVPLSAVASSRCKVPTRASRGQCCRYASKSGSVLSRAGRGYCCRYEQAGTKNDVESAGDALACLSVVQLLHKMVINLSLRCL